MRTRITVLSENVTRAAKILRVTRGELLRAFGGQLTVRDSNKRFRPIRWDGSARGADRVLRHMPDLTVATYGGAPGHPAQLFLRTKRGRDRGEAKEGDWIGIDQRGNACVVSEPR